MKLVEKRPWADKAACRGIPLTVFYDDIEDDRPGAVQQALSFCNKCAVRAECLDSAMREEGAAPAGRYGLRGGLLPDERGNTRRSQRLR